MTRKKLAIIRSSYRSDGGAERIIARMLEGLQTHYTMDVSLITKKWQAGENDGFTIIQCPKRGLLRHRKFQNFNDDVTELLQQHTFDLVQSHERISGCQIYRAGDGVHKQWLEIRQQNASAIQSFLWDHSPYHNTILHAEKTMFAHPKLKKVICNATQIKHDILKHYPDTPADKLVVIYNGINLEAFSFCDHERQQQAREDLALNKNDKILLYVGSGFQRKGLATLLHALPLAADWKLIVVGKDKKIRFYQRLCKQLNIEQRVIFSGKQSNVQNYYAASDLLVHPALYDPAPNVVLEAMASGRGVIVSQNCGNHNLIEEGKNGFVFEAGNSKKLISLLNNCSDRQEFIKLGNHARKTAECYPTSRMINSLTSLYNDLLAE
ncbi:MAG: glycosyltransferase family 4 protein [Endozoicomonadaceae bacterium]|nr:glycosyltransferase family 4 protein [Endozoicomonadaceae bacterium]